jgi:hypothetical protein
MTKQDAIRELIEIGTKLDGRGVSPSTISALKGWVEMSSNPEHNLDDAVHRLLMFADQRERLIEIIMRLLETEEGALAYSRLLMHLLLAGVVKVEDIPKSAKDTLSRIPVSKPE